MKIFITLLASMLLTGCASGGLSDANENAYISGSGIAVYIDQSERRDAPKFSGQTLTSGFVSLKTNQVTVINVWASWCAPCRAEAPLLQESSIKYPQVQFAGVLTRDNLSSARAFYDNFNLTYPTFIDDAVLVGFKGSLIPNAIPTTLIIDRYGKVAVRISGVTTLGGFQRMLEKVIADA